MPSTKPTRQDLGSRHTTLQVESKPASVLAEYKALRYDYRRVASNHRQAVQDAAVDIRRKQKRAMEDMLAIGRRLIEVKDFLPFGRFEEWVEMELEMTIRHAENIMNAARAYSDEAKAKRVSLLSDGSVYLLASPSTPDEARDEVERIIETTGKVPTRAEVQQIILEAKAKRVSLLKTDDEIKSSLGPPAPESRMIEMRAETPMAEPVQISAAKPDHPDLQEAGFVMHRTDQGYRYFWPTRGERKQSYGPIRSTQAYAEEDALTALALTVVPEPEPTMPADLAAAGYTLVKRNYGNWRWELDKVWGGFKGSDVGDVETAILRAREDHAARTKPAPAAPTPVAPGINDDPMAAERELYLARLRDIQLILPPHLEAAGYVIQQRDKGGEWWRFTQLRQSGVPVFGLWRTTKAHAIEDATMHFEHFPQQQNEAAAQAIPEPAIEAEYTVAKSTPNTAPAALTIDDRFQAWLNACPTGLGLRQYLAIFELGKVAAQKARAEEPALYNVVTNALVPWSQLIHKLAGLLK